MTIKLTEKAAKFAQQIMAENKLADHVIRVNVDTATGAYGLDVVDDVHDNDRTFSFHGVKVVCDPKAYLYLHDTTIDYAEASGGFAFSPPSARR